MAFLGKKIAGEYGVHCDKNILIPVRDGVTLAADIYRPASPGQFPAILQMYPYRKDDTFLGQERSGVAPAEDHVFAAKGYAEVWIDTRGTGGSDGVSLRMYGREEVEDAHDVIAWVAEQPWCTGKVGITGMSYGGYNSFIIAASNPPHLEAAAPMGAGVSQHHHFHPGGCMPMYLWLVLYMPRMLAMNLSPPSYLDDEGRWKEIWDRHIEGNYPWLLNLLDNPPSSLQWDEYSIDHRLGELRIPTLFISGLMDITTYCHLPFFDSGRVKGPFKMILGPWIHLYPDESPVEQIEHKHEILRWFDYWLKGEDTGVLNEPPIAIYVQRLRKPTVFPTGFVGEWRYEDEWPLKRVEETCFFLAPGGKLVDAAPACEGADSFIYDPSVGTMMGLPAGGSLGYVHLDQREDDVRSLTYTSEPLEEGLEVTGVPRVNMYASSSADSVNYVVKLCDVSPDGSSVAVSRGMLNGARRFSREPSPLVPGEIYELDMWMEGLAYVFEERQKIRISISSSDFPYMWPAPKHSTNTVYRCSGRFSRLILPVVPEQTLKRGRPRFKKSSKAVIEWLQRPNQTPLTNDRKRTSYEVIKDFVKSRVKVHSRSHKYLSSGKKSILIDNVQNASVSTRDPADARADTSVIMKVISPGIKSQIEVRSLVQSDLECFNVSLLAKITLNGSPYAEKQWIKTYPREFM